jgi:AcrR family transcriptional regulator
MVLDAAAACIEETSLLDFTMSSLSKKSGLSMGSVYKQVQTKEDVLVALATQHFARMRDRFEEILTLPLSMPERLIAVHQMDPAKVQAHSFDAHLEMLIGNEALLLRASRGWHERMTRQDVAIEDLFASKIEQACEAGELLVDEDERQATLDQLCASLWSMYVGYMQVNMQRHARTLLGTPVPLPYPLAMNDPLLQSIKRLLNTFPWKTALDDAGIERANKALEEKGFR